MDALNDFLRAEGLDIVWTVLSEKTVLVEDRHGWPGRLELSGAYALEAGNLIGKIHHKFVGPE